MPEYRGADPRGAFQDNNEFGFESLYTNPDVSEDPFAALYSEDAMSALYSENAPPPDNATDVGAIDSAVRGLKVGAAGTVESLFGAPLRWIGDVTGGKPLVDIANELSAWSEQIQHDNPMDVDVAVPILDKFQSEGFGATVEMITDPRWYMYMFGTAVPTMATFMVPAAAAGRVAQAAGWGKRAIDFAQKSKTITKLMGGSPTWQRAAEMGVGGVMNAVLEGGSVYNELRAKGQSPWDASLAAGAVAATNFGMGALSSAQLFEAAEGSRFALKALHGAKAEGAEEVLQQISSNIATGKPWYDGVPESAIVGIGMGSTVGPALDAIGDYRNNKIKTQSEKDQEVAADRLREEYERLAAEEAQKRIVVSDEQSAALNAEMAQWSEYGFQTQRVEEAVEDLAVGDSFVYDGQEYHIAKISIPEEAAPDPTGQRMLTPGKITLVGSRVEGGKRKRVKLTNEDIITPQVGVSFDPEASQETAELKPATPMTEWVPVKEQGLDVDDVFYDTNDNEFKVMAVRPDGSVDAFDMSSASTDPRESIVRFASSAPVRTEGVSRTRNAEQFEPDEQPAAPPPATQDEPQRDPVALADEQGVSVRQAEQLIDANRQAKTTEAVEQRQQQRKYEEDENATEQPAEPDATTEEGVQRRPEASQNQEQEALSLTGVLANDRKFDVEIAKQEAVGLDNAGENWRTRAREVAPTSKDLADISDAVTQNRERIREDAGVTRAQVLRELRKKQVPGGGIDFSKETYQEMVNRLAQESKPQREAKQASMEQKVASHRKSSKKFAPGAGQQATVEDARSGDTVVPYADKKDISRIVSANQHNQARLLITEDGVVYAADADVLHDEMMYRVGSGQDMGRVGRVVVTKTDDGLVWEGPSGLDYEFVEEAMFWLGAKHQGGVDGDTFSDQVNVLEDSRSLDGKEISVNPTAREIRKKLYDLKQQGFFADVKIIVTSDGNVLAADGNKALHDELASAIGVSGDRVAHVEVYESDGKPVYEISVMPKNTRDNVIKAMKRLGIQPVSQEMLDDRSTEQQQPVEQQQDTAPAQPQNRNEFVAAVRDALSGTSMALDTSVDEYVDATVSVWDAIFDTMLKRNIANVGNDATLDDMYRLFGPRFTTMSAVPGRDVRGRVRLSSGNETDIVELAPGAQLDTVMHESMHVAQSIGVFTKSEQALLMGQFNVDPKSGWTIAQSEQLANAFVDYLRTGSAPTPKLRPVFVKLRAWLSTIRDWIMSFHSGTSQRDMLVSELNNMSSYKEDTFSYGELESSLESIEALMQGRDVDYAFLEWISMLGGKDAGRTAEYFWGIPESERMNWVNRARMLESSTETKTRSDIPQEYQIELTTEMRQAFGRMLGAEFASSRNFNEWFKQSAASEERDFSGWTARIPIVLKHGTGRSFPAFSLEKLGETTRAPSAKEGIFLTPDDATTRTYSRISSEMNELVGNYGGLTDEEQQELYDLEEKLESAEKELEERANDIVSDLPVAVEIEKELVRLAADYHVPAGRTMGFIAARIVHGDNLDDVIESLSVSRPGADAMLQENKERIVDLVNKLRNDYGYSLYELQQRIGDDSYVRRKNALNDGMYTLNDNISKFVSEGWMWDEYKKLHESFVSDNDRYHKLVANEETDEEVRVGEQIYPVYASIQNPLVHDFSGESYREVSYFDLIKKAKTNGHDGVIMKNTYDGGNMTDVYVVFKPEQIKSVFNSGTWATDNPNMLEDKRSHKSGPHPAGRMREILGSMLHADQPTAAWDNRYIEVHPDGTWTVSRWSSQLGNDPVFNVERAPSEPNGIGAYLSSSNKATDPNIIAAAEQLVAEQGLLTRTHDRAPESSDRPRVLEDSRIVDHLLQRRQPEHNIEIDPNLHEELARSQRIQRDGQEQAEELLRKRLYPYELASDEAQREYLEYVSGGGQTASDFARKMNQTFVENRLPLAKLVDMANDFRGEDNALPINEDPMKQAVLYGGFAGDASVLVGSLGQAYKRAGGPTAKSITPEQEFYLEHYMRNKMYIARERNLSAKFPKRDPKTFNPDGMTSVEAKRALKSIENIVGKEQWENLKAAEAEVAKVFALELRALQESGLISETAYKTLSEQNKKYGDYLGPFQVIHYASERIMEGNGGQSPTNINVYDQDVVQGLTGTTRLITDMLESGPQYLFRSVQLRRRNNVMEQIWQLRNRVNGKGLDQIILPYDGKEQRRGYDLVHWYQHGQRVSMQVPKELAEVLKGMDHVASNWLLKAFSKQSNWLRLGATAWSPTFSARNVFRDYTTQLITADHPIMSLSEPAELLSDIALVARSLFAAMETTRGRSGELTKAYEDWLKSGGAFSTRESRIEDFGGTRGAVAGKDRLLGRDTRGAFDRITDGLAAMSRVSEETMRLAVFLKHQDKYSSYEGVTPDQVQQMAGYMSRRATVDFAQHGQAMRVLRMLAPFTNARIQGFATNVRGIKQHPTRAKAFALAAGVVSVWLFKYGREVLGRAYDDIPEHDKERNWIIPIGVTEGSDGRMKPEYFTIPKGEYFELVTSFVEGALRYMNDTSISGGFSLGDTVMQTLSNASPFSFATDGELSLTRAMMEFTPPVVKAIWETRGAGWDSFRNRKLLNPEEESRKVEDQYKPYTTVGARELGSMFKMSPIKLDHAARTIFGEFGSMVLEAPFLFSKQPDDRTQMNRKERLSRYPIVRAFYKVRGGEIDSKMFDIIQEVRADYASRAFQASVQAKRFLVPLFKDGKLSDELKQEFSGYIRSIDSVEEVQALRNTFKAGTKNRLGPDKSLMRVIAQMGKDSGERSEGIYRILVDVAQTKEERVAILMELGMSGVIDEEELVKIIGRMSGHGN